MDRKKEKKNCYIYRFIHTDFPTTCIYRDNFCITLNTKVRKLTNSRVVIECYCGCTSGLNFEQKWNFVNWESNAYQGRWYYIYLMALSPFRYKIYKRHSLSNSSIIFVKYICQIIPILYRVIFMQQFPYIRCMSIADPPCTYHTLQYLLTGMFCSCRNVQWLLNPQHVRRVHCFLGRKKSLSHILGFKGTILAGLI